MSAISTRAASSWLALGVQRRVHAVGIGQGPLIVVAGVPIDTPRRRLRRRHRGDRAQVLDGGSGAALGMEQDLAAPAVGSWRIAVVDSMWSEAVFAPALPGRRQTKVSLASSQNIRIGAQAEALAGRAWCLPCPSARAPGRRRCPARSTRQRPCPPGPGEAARAQVQVVHTCAEPGPRAEGRSSRAGPGRSAPGPGTEWTRPGVAQHQRGRRITDIPRPSANPNRTAHAVDKHRAGRGPYEAAAPNASPSVSTSPTLSDRRRTGTILLCHGSCRWSSAEADLRTLETLHTGRVFSPA